MTWNTAVQDLYIRLVDPEGKLSDIVSHHRVWDRNRFIQSLRERYEKAEGSDRRLVKVTTQGVYRKAMGYKPEHCHDN